MESKAEPARQNLVLVGFMGTGKSTIGRQVARRLGFQFLDMDHVIVEREGAPVAELFAERGEPAFRDLETAALRSLGHLNRVVISTGGGAVVREENRPLLRELGFVVGLTASEEVIYERVSRNQSGRFCRRRIRARRSALCWRSGRRRIARLRRWRWIRARSRRPRWWSGSWRKRGALLRGTGAREWGGLAVKVQLALARHFFHWRTTALFASSHQVRTSTRRMHPAFCRLLSR